MSEVDEIIALKIVALAEQRDAAERKLEAQRKQIERVGYLIKEILELEKCRPFANDIKAHNIQLGLLHHAARHLQLDLNL